MAPDVQRQFYVQSTVAEAIAHPSSMYDLGSGLQILTTKPVHGDKKNMRTYNKTAPDGSTINGRLEKRFASPILQKSLTWNKEGIITMSKDQLQDAISAQFEIQESLDSNGEYHWNKVTYNNMQDALDQAIIQIIK